jgi:hypothetical protein
VSAQDKRDPERWHMDEIDTIAVSRNAVCQNRYRVAGGISEEGDRTPQRKTGEPTSFRMTGIWRTTEKERRCGY